MICILENLASPSSATLICFLLPMIENQPHPIKRAAAIIILSSFPSGNTICFRCFLALLTNYIETFFGVIPSASKVISFSAKLSKSTYFSK
jgi:hypothetical protein